MAAQSYHNAGGIILCGPGGQEDLSTYNAQDLLVYDAIGKKGEELTPGYRYLKKVVVKSAAKIEFVSGL